MATGYFEGRRIAVTGAGGFIGGAVARELHARGAEVVGIDLGEAAAGRMREAGAEPRLADVTVRPTVEAALDGVDAVVHAAACVREWGSMAEFVEVNSRGTATVLDAAAATGATRVAHVSSVVVYGYDDPAEQDEDAFRRICGLPYIDTKSASDRLACRRGAIVVRPGDVYGPGSVPWTVRPLELARAGRLALPAPGEGLMLPVYVDDLVEGVLLALARGEPGRAYAVWDGSPVPFRDYFGRIAVIAGAEPPRVLPRWLLEAAAAVDGAWSRLRGRAPVVAASAATYVGRRGTVSTERIRSELGWRPLVGLDEGIERSADWARTRGLAGP